MVSPEIIFIDEIHSIGKNVGEMLYSAMEDYVIDLVVGKELNSRSIRFNLPKFILFAATTKIETLDNALISRFGNC
jgi:Holliday junction DNA helicase RuvB